MNIKIKARLTTWKELESKNDSLAFFNDLQDLLLKYGCKTSSIQVTLEVAPEHA